MPAASAKTEILPPPATVPPPAAPSTASARLPLRAWALEFARRWNGGTYSLFIHLPEKLVPASEEANASTDERMNLVTFLKWAAAPELAHLDVGVVLITESADELNARLLQNPYVAQVRIDLPDAEERLRFLQSGWAECMADGKPFSDWSDFTPQELAARTAGLNLLRIRHFLAESIRNGARTTQ